MITLSMPVGSAHGWGICGKYLTREIAALTGGQMRLITEQFKPEDLSDELEYQAIAACLFTPQDNVGVVNTGGVSRLPHPLLTCILDKTMRCWMPQVRGTRTVGYTFFEENILQPAWIEEGRRLYDVVATGSSWCTEVLRSCGLPAQTVIQGVDPRVFFPWPEGDTPEREFLRDRFVVFSGGKFELRKGQDIVIRAVKVLQDRHRDVVLVNAWFNAWPQSIETMRASRHVRFPSGQQPGNFVEFMRRFLAENGMDLSRVVTLGPRPNALMPRIYRNTDVGIFPNRCEGGTNLVLMEYMACGKPVVAVASTGHSDVVREANAFVISTPTENTLSNNTGPVARWPEPSLDDAVDKLEQAYQHRDQLAQKGRQAGEDMKALTWTAAGRRFLELLTA